MLELIRVRPTQDGTYTVYRGPIVLAAGLNRLQAERYEASLSHRRETVALASGG